jgi:hypothetical protein
VTVPAAATETPLEGVTEWRNARNGIYVAQVHYTADPAKRSEAWRVLAKQGLDKKAWLREFEISFDIPEGEPVFPEYDPGRMRRALRVLPDARLCRFWDFGHACPVCLFAQVDAWGRLCILRELVLPHTALQGLIYAVKATTLELMHRPDINAFDAGDPSGEKMTDLGQVRAILHDHGIELHTTPSTVKGTWGDEGSYQQLRTRFLQTVIVPVEGPSPTFLIDTSCERLHSALCGNFHKSQKEPFRPVDVHPYKDVCDALRYGNANLLGISSDWMKKMAAVAKQDARW